MVRRASGAGTLRASLESSMSSGRLLVRNCKPRPVLQNSPGPRQARAIRPESVPGGRSGGGLGYFVVEGNCTPTPDLPFRLPNDSTWATRPMKYHSGRSSPRISRGIVRCNSTKSPSASFKSVAKNSPPLEMFMVSAVCSGTASDSTGRNRSGTFLMSRRAVRRSESRIALPLFRRGGNRWQLAGLSKRMRRQGSQQSGGSLMLAF